MFRPLPSRGEFAMAFPQKAFEQLTYASIRTPGWSGQLLMIASTIFFVSLGFYLGIGYGYLPYLRGKLAEVNDEIQSFSQQIPLAEQEKIVAFYSQLVNMRLLLGNHIHTSPLFRWLEENTVKQVAYSKLTVRTGAQEIGLSGYARSADDVAKQLRVFELQQEVRTVNLSSLTLGSNGLWQFDAKITFVDRYFEEVVPLSLPTSESPEEKKEESP